jgi:hypothetical protein
MTDSDKKQHIFSFDKNEHFTHIINDRLKLHIEKSNVGTAELFFSLDDQYIDVHEDVIVLEEVSYGKLLVEHNNQDASKPLVNIHNVTHYYLSSNKKYEVRYKNKAIFSLVPRNCWKIVT